MFEDYNVNVHLLYHGALRHIVSSGRCCRNGGSGAMADGDGAWDSVLSEQYSVPAVSA